MATSNTPDNTVLALDPPKINGQTEPVVGAMAGLSKAAYELVADGEGAVVIVDPPLAGTINPGDVMKLWLKDDPAVLDSETIADPSAKTTLRLPKGRLHSDRVNEVLYTIERGSSNIGTSPPLTVLYNFIRLGLKDRLTVPGGHSELKLLLPDTIKNGVGPDFVSAMVCVSHPYGRAYDRIDLKCNGELMAAYVGKDQAPQPPDPGSEEPITFCFTVDRAFLDRAKRLDQKLNFSYTGTDQIGNGPDPDAPWSPVQTVDEDLDGTRLPMAILLERMEDYPGDDAEEIDLNKLAGGPLLLVVPTIDQRFVAGYEVIATYTAKNTGQPADVVVTVSGKVETDPFGQKKPCILEVPNNKIFAGSNVSVTYELHKPNGDLAGSSRPATGTVTGSTPEDLLPPFLVAPAANPIDVLAYPNGVTVRIEYLDAQKGDRARLVEVDAPAGSPQFPLVEFNSNKRVNTVLSPAFLVARHGTVIELRWNLNRNNAQIGKSTILTLNVLKIADGDSRLPEPKIQESDNTDKIDLNNFMGDATFDLPSWNFAEEGQLILATLSNDSDTPLTIINNAPLTPEEVIIGIKKPISRDWLNKIQTDTSVYLEVKASPKNIENLNQVVFLKKRYTIINETRLISENWENTHYQSFIPNFPVNFRSGLTFTLISGSAYLATPNHPSYPSELGKTTLFLGRGRSLFTLSFEARKMSFIIVANHLPGTATFKAKDNTIVGTATIPITVGFTPSTVTFTSPTTLKFSSFELNIPDDLYADNFLISQSN